MKIKFKKLDDRATLPSRGSVRSSGLDLHSIDTMTLRPGNTYTLMTGLAVELPQGTEGQVRPRSGLARRHGITVLNAPGTIDEDYTGEIGVILVHHGKKNLLISEGDRIAQLVVAPVVYPKASWAEEIKETERGSDGFGSTGV